MLAPHFYSFADWFLKGSETMVNVPTLDVAPQSGVVRRLVLTTTTRSERDQARAVPGATVAQDRNRVTFPTEPYLVDDLSELYPDLALTEGAQVWYNSWKFQRERSMYITTLDDWKSINGICLEPWASKLYPYQRVGAQWLRQRKRALLGDDPGLGKTVQALTAAGSVPKVLVVTFNTVKSHWGRQVQQWTERQAYVANGERKQRISTIEQALKQPQAVLIINHEMLRGQGLKDDPFAELFRVVWDVVILDEAHVFQGRDSKQSLGAEKLKTKALYELTGTPIWSRPESIWHLLKLLDPNRFSSFWNWVDAYCTTQITEYGLSIVGFRPDRLPRLKSILAEYILRRHKEDVLPELPEKIIQYVPYKMSEWQTTQHRAMQRKLVRLDDEGAVAEHYDSAIQVYAQLRHLLNHPAFVDPNYANYSSPKDTVIKELLQELIDGRDGKNKVILFTWHVNEAEYLHNILFNMYGTRLLTGHTADSARDSVVNEFRTSPYIQLLIATIGAAGIGIDLVEASAAIFVEGSPVHSINVQAEDRLHRIGQHVIPTIYRLYAEDSVEEEIWSVADRRQDISNEVLALREIVARLLQSHEQYSEALQTTL